VPYLVKQELRENRPLRPFFLVVEMQVFLVAFLVFTFGLKVVIMDGPLVPVTM
jgi:hypothetical protein